MLFRSLIKAVIAQDAKQKIHSVLLRLVLLVLTPIISAPLSLICANFHSASQCAELAGCTFIPPISPQTGNFQSGANKTYARQFRAMWWRKSIADWGRLRSRRSLLADPIVEDLLQETLRRLGEWAWRA